jgi:rhomboid family protein
MPFDNLRNPGPQRGAGERAINLPPAIMWLIGINVVVHLVREFLLSDSVDQELVLKLGLVPANITGDQGNLLLSLVSLITYQFLHGGWVHLGVNIC